MKKKFLAALSSSRSLVVGPLVRPSVGGVFEKVRERERERERERDLFSDGAKQLCKQTAWPKFTALFTHFLNFFMSSFSNLCMIMIGEFLYLSVLA